MPRILFFPLGEIPKQHYFLEENMKKLVSLALVALMAAALFAGCSGGAKDDGKVRVAVVIAGGLGDRSFYDSAKSGLDKLLLDYDNVEGKILECKEDSSMFKQQLINAAETCDFVVAVGWQFYDGLAEIAPEFKDTTKFIYVDQAVEGIDNIYNIKYSQNEGSFLVGYIAAKYSQTGKVGAVGGEDDAVINDFIVGYTQGAKYANPACMVEVNYAGTYEDPAKGKECALALYGKGCDVVFQIAGKTGEGVFAAAQEQGKYAIGVDSDQKYINPDRILCSMIKQVGNSIYDTVAAFINDGTWKGGTTWVADMASGYVDVGYGEEGSAQQVSDELKAEVEALKQKIISGEIEVDTTR